MVLLRTLAATLALTLAGCANLKAVRTFAGESARFTAYQELTERFQDTYRREQPYVFGPAAELAKDNDRRRKLARKDLLELHRTLAQYLRTLAVLAGDRTFEVSEGLEALGAGLAEHPDLGLEARHVEACTGLALVVAKWVAAQRQAQALQSMLREGDPPLQTLTRGMASLVEHYRRTHENERRAVTGLLEVELAYADRPQERLLATLGKAHLQAKVREYELAEASYADALRGLRAIQDGHRQLLANVDRLSGSEVRATLERLTQDLQTIRRSLEVAHAR